MLLGRVERCLDLFLGHQHKRQGKASSCSRATCRAEDPEDGQTGVLRDTGYCDRRTLPGVGTYLIDTPKDAGHLLRQRLLSFQEQNRGLGQLQNDALLPDIPFRLNPKPDLCSCSLSTMNQPSSILKADVATSPMGDEDSNHPPSRTASPALSSARTVTFAAEPHVNPVRTQGMENLKAQSSGHGVKRTGSKHASSLDKSVMCRERTDERKVAKTVRECTKVKLYSLNAEGAGQESQHSHVPGAFPDFPDTARTHRTHWTKKKSSSLSDLTDFGVLFSLFHKDNGDAKTTTTTTPRCVDSRPGKLGSDSFLHSRKSKSLLDLKSIQDCDQADLSAYHKRQRIAHLAFRRDNSVRHARALSMEEADKEWMEMANTPVVNDTQYDKFASRRKPVVSSNSKKTGKSYAPKSGSNFKIAQPAGGGKVFPVFFNDGLPVRKFGHAMNRRKTSKSKA